MRVIKTQLIGNAADGILTVEQEVLGLFHYKVIDVVFGRPARLFFEQIAEVVSGQVDLAGQVLHCGYALFNELTGVKIILQQPLEPSQ